MPQAVPSIRIAWPATVPNAGRAPPISTPAAYAITFAIPRAKATMAATVTHGGRSPGASGSSAARARSLRSSDRDGGRALDMRAHHGRPQLGGGRTRIRGVANRAHHGDPLGAGGNHVSHVARVDSADREEGSL